MKILLAVTGSISAYKAYDLVREFVKSGHEIKIMLSQGAKNFIKGQTFFYLGASDVFEPTDDFNIAKNKGKVLHIQLREWMDLLLIAPASANTLAKLANGICDDLIGSVFVSNKMKPIIFFPAMNTQMLQNPVTQKNINYLSSLENIFVHPPTKGLLICKEEGEGKLPEIQTIFDIATTYPKALVKKKVLITTGPTIVPIDPIRYITNPSSGKTGYEISKKYLEAGYEVVLIHGPNCQFPSNSLIYHPHYKQIATTTTEDMYKAVQIHFDSSDIYISSAAVSDFKFQSFNEKLKKNESTPTLTFEWSTDILKEMLKRKSDQKIISFAAETTELIDNFKKKWTNKPVDLLIGNQVHNGKSGNARKGFSEDQNTYFFVKQGDIFQESTMTKKELANFIFQFTNDSHD